MDTVAAIVAKAKTGHRASYETLVRRFQDMAQAYAFAHLQDHALAEDAAQEAFVEAYQKLGSLREDAAFPGWLKAIVFKHCDRITRRKGFRAHDAEALTDLAWDGASAETRLTDEEAARHVAAALRSLSPALSEVATLHFAGEHTAQEIGAFLAIPLTTVKKRLHDARHKLKERIENMVENNLRDKAPSKTDKLVDAVTFRLAVWEGDVVTVAALAAKNPALCRLPANDGLPMLLHVLHRERHGEISGMADALVKYGAPYDIYSAAAHGTVDDVKKLLDAEPSLINAEQYWQMTALKWAAHAGNDAVAKFLLDRGADVNHVGTGWTPLHQAAECGHGTTVELLLARGADLHAKIAGLWSALHVAAEGGQLETVRFLEKKGLEYDLFAAAALGDVARAEEILATDPETLRRVLPKRLTALGMASQSKRAAMARFLVKKGARLTIVDCLQLGWRDDAKALIAKDPANVNELTGVYGFSALHHAARYDDREMGALLLASGADKTLKDLTFASTPEGWARYFDRAEALDWFM